MNSIIKRFLCLVLLASATLGVAFPPGTPKVKQTSMALHHLFPDFHAKAKDFILSGVELGRTTLEGFWKITKPELAKFGAYMKTNFVKDASNMHTGKDAANTNLDIAKSIGAKALAGFILYDACCGMQWLMEQKYGLPATRGWLASAFSNYDNNGSPREPYLNNKVKWALRAAFVASLVV
jgi:hypothetical protein